MLLDIGSHPAWVCGLKLLPYYIAHAAHLVTPCVGVWIETNIECGTMMFYKVTPCVGVWIETLRLPMVYTMSRSHTLRGCVD